MAEYSYTQSPMYQGNANRDYQWIGGKLVNVSDVQGLYNNYLQPGGLAAQAVPAAPYKAEAITPTTPTYNFDGIKGTSQSVANNPWNFNSVNNATNAGDIKVDVDTHLANSTGTPPPADQSWGDKFSSWFTPDGKSGQSLGGNVMGAIGTGIQGLSGLAGMYYAKKNYDLQKDAQDWEKNRVALADKNTSTFAANAGNAASYNGVVS